MSFRSDSSLAQPTTSLTALFWVHIALLSELIMRTLFILFILHLIAVRGDARLRREIDELYAGVEGSEFNPRREEGALGAMLAPRLDPGAVASNICGYLGGQPSSCHI